MKRATRVILLGISCLLFILIAPAVVLYAIGYRLNPANGVAHPVGVLLVATQPRGATIQVNGTDIGRTPRAVPNLAPGTADLSVTLDSFRPWQKRVTIEATKATDFQHIRLFPTTPATTLLTENVTDITLSPNERFLAAIIGKTTIRILDPQGLAIRQFSLPVVPTNMTWSPDSSALLVETSRRPYILNVSNAAPQALTPPAGRILGWDRRLPDRLIIVTANSSIISYATAPPAGGGAATTLIPASDIVTLADNSVYVAAGSKLQEYGYDGTLRQTFTTPLPAATRRLLANNSGVVAAIDAAEHLTLITTTAPPAGGGAVPVGKVKEAIFSPDGSFLALQTALNEVQVYNVGNETDPAIPLHTAQLVSRLSRPIHHLTWFAGSSHLLYQVDDELVITETDTRDHVITTALDTTNTGDAKATPDGAGETLYYIKKEGRTSTLTKMDLVGE